MNKVHAASVKANDTVTMQVIEKYTPGVIPEEMVGYYRAQVMMIKDVDRRDQAMKLLAARDEKATKQAIRDWA